MPGQIESVNSGSALELDAAGLPPGLRLALQASAAGDVDAAVRLFLDAAQAHPGSAEPHFLLAAELAQAGRIEASESAYARALLIAPGLWIARFQLGLLQLTTDRAALALLSWQPLLDLDDGEPLKHFVLAFSAWAQGQLSEARRLFESGLRLNQALPALNVDMALALARLIEQIKGQPGATAIAAEGATVASGESGHVLLSNYRALG